MGEFAVGAYIVFSTAYFIWLGKTVRTQANTIDALQALLDSMGTVLKSTDERTMLGRLKAYKEFVDQEKEAHIKRVKQETVEALKEFKKGAASRVEHLLSREEQLVTSLFTVIVRLIPYVPRDERTTQIGSVDFGDRERFKKTIMAAAGNAPFIAQIAKDAYSAAIKDIYANTLQIVSTSPKKD